MEEEILNIQYHTRRLILKALNRHKKNKPAAEALGIHIRTLYQQKKDLGVRKVNGVFDAPHIKIISINPVKEYEKS